MNKNFVCLCERELLRSKNLYIRKFHRCGIFAYDLYIAFFKYYLFYVLVVRKKYLWKNLMKKCEAMTSPKKKNSCSLSVI